MLRPYLVSVTLFVVGLIYHHNGQNDWLTPAAVGPHLTPHQIANEIISSILIASAMVICALIPSKKEG